MVIATGAEEYRPTEYLAGTDDRVVTQLDLHEKLHDGGLPDGTNRVVMIQCVGSRTEEHPYCSRICCTQAVANAIRLKELQPTVDVTILFRDMRTFSLKELAYRRARDLGVRFVKFDPDQPPQVTAAPDGLEIHVFDHVLREPLVLAADLLALSAAVRPQSDSKKLASSLKLPLDADGFFMEAHMKLRPVDFVSSGFFMAGTAHGPQVSGRMHGPGQGCGVASGFGVVQGRDVGRRRSRHRGPGTLRGLPDLRAHLPVRRAASGRKQLCVHRSGRLPGLRFLRCGLPAPGHPGGPDHTDDQMTAKAGALYKLERAG